jgi:hypothetical protein
MGVNDPYAREFGNEERRQGASPVLTASIGEDFADCGWPVTVKAQSQVTRDQLVWYLTKLFEAVDEGFFMDPTIGPAIYWRWAGTVLPGITPDEAGEPTDAEVSVGQEVQTGERSPPGNGPLCGIYLVDEAARWEGDDFYGTVSGDVAVSGSVGEDYAASKWPLVVKVHAGVPRGRFCEYLNGLIACLNAGLYYQVPDLSRPPTE